LLSGILRISDHLMKSYAWFGNFGDSILNPEFAINEYAVPGIAINEYTVPGIA